MKINENDKENINDNKFIWEMYNKKYKPIFNGLNSKLKLKIPKEKDDVN
jgi:hypothetical protein